MTKKILWLMFSWLMVATLVLASCGDGVPGEQEEEEEEEEEEGVLGFPRSETLIAANETGRITSPDNFNEWVGWKQRDRGMATLMNETLWITDYVGGEIVNSLAAGPPEYNEDFTEVTIELREGVYWSDGVEFTADDVVFTIELLKATPGMNYNVQLQTVERAYAEDRYTAVVEITEPNSRFHCHFIDRWGCCWIMPKHVFEQVEDPIAFEYNPPLSTGPYVLHSYDPEGFWTAWERRDDWEKTPTGMLYGEPVPKYVVYHFVGVPATMIMAMGRHELDVPTPITMEALRAALTLDPDARAYRLEYPWGETDHPCATGISFNTLKPPFDNRDVRWALTLAVDIASYNATAFDGIGMAAALGVSSAPLNVETYYKPMEQWLVDFTLDLGNGETFQPYDPEAAYSIAAYAEARGYTVPEDIKETFGYGWWKYAPDVAATLLKNNGFSRDAKGKWLLPDGTPWKFTILTGVMPGHASYQNAFAAMHEWKKFGIDVDVETSEMAASLERDGLFDVATEWPSGASSWGGYPDLYRVFDQYNSTYVEPVLGEPHFGHPSRWSDPRMDEVITGLKRTDWNDLEQIAELGIEGLKIIVEEMAPGMVTFAYPSPIIWSTYYWTNWPGAENRYSQPFSHWPDFKYMLPFLEPTGR